MRVLAVDDEKLFQSIIRAALVARGHHVDAVETAAECLERLSGDHGYEVVLLDRWLKQSDGLDLLRTLRSSPAHRDLPVILQTSSSTATAIREGLDAGAFYYLTKPYADDLLTAVVEAARADRRRMLELGQQLDDAPRAYKLVRSLVLEVRTLEDAEQASRLAARALPDPQRAITGLIELTTNAVEHGNLEISYEEKSRLLAEGRWTEAIAARLKEPRFRHRRARIWLERRDEQTTLTVSDEGPGFDWSRYLDFDPARASHAHGRGIALARMASFETLRYLGTGNEVQAVVRHTP